MAKPFFSGNYGSALARVDTRPIVEAGRAQGQMYANMGSQIGGMIKEYGLNKEKQGKLTDKIENRLKLDPSIAQRLTMSGDEDYDKTNITDMEKLTKGELGLKGLQRLDSAMATINEVDLQKQAEEDREMKKSAFKLSQLTQQLSNDNTRLRNQIAELTKDDVVEAVGADARAKTTKANISETEEAYQKDVIKKDLENKQSLIDYRKAATLSMFLKQNNINAPVPKDLEKRYSEISTLLPKLDNTKIKVKTTGIFGAGFNAEEKEIPYSEYKENPDDYAPLVTDQLKGLQLQENALKEELSQLTLSTPIPYTNDDTGAQGITTVGEMLKFQTQSKNNTPTNPQSMPLGQEDMMMLDQPGTTIGVPQVPNFSR
jgi:hypothetical protein